MLQLVANRPQMIITHPSHLHQFTSPLIFITLFSCPPFLPSFLPPDLQCVGLESFPPLPVNMDAQAIKVVKIQIHPSFISPLRYLSGLKQTTCAWVGVWMSVYIFVYPPLHVYEYVCVCVGLSLWVCHIDETGSEKPKLSSRHSVSSDTFDYVISSLWISHHNQHPVT